MTIKTPFDPHYGSNQVLTVTNTTQAATLERGNKQLRLVNTGANVAHVRVYSSSEAVTPVATTADFPIPGGMASVITKKDTYDSIAYISALGTTLHVMQGEGW